MEPDGMNTGKLKYQIGFERIEEDGKSYSKQVKFNNVIIKRNKFIYNYSTHPIRSEDVKYYKRVYFFESVGKYVYHLKPFGSVDGRGFHISMSWWQHQIFLWLQKRHWFQKEENIRYIVNILFLIIGVGLSIIKLKG